MFVVAIRGAIWGQQIASVSKDAMAALLLFTVFGAIAGWIAEYLIRDSLERTFRNRVDWYRQGLIDAEREETSSVDDE